MGPSCQGQPEFTLWNQGKRHVGSCRIHQKCCNHCPFVAEDLVSTEQVLLIVLQVLIVLVTWLCVAPTLTCWLWRISFMRSFSQVNLLRIWCILFGVPRKEILVRLIEGCRFFPRGLLLLHSASSLCSFWQTAYRYHKGESFSK